MRFVGWGAKWIDSVGAKTIQNLGAMGMEGTLSARPEGVVVPAQERGWSTILSGKVQGSRPQISELLERRRLSIHAGAAMLATVAAAAHVIEPVPQSIAPVCAMLAAVLVAFLACMSWAPSQLHADTQGDADHSGSVPGEVVADRAAGKSSGMSANRNPNLAAELAQAAALAQLTARISHDLRTPLNAVIGFSELMSQETFGPLGSQRYQDYAKHIRECGQTLLKSTEDTLAITSALARPMGEPCAAGVRPISLLSLVNEAWESVALHAAQESISIDCSIPVTLELVGERRVMRQVLINILQDAVSRGHWQSVIQVRGELDGNAVRLTIEVKGCSDSEPEETLSLHVARALLELHGLPLTTSAGGHDHWQVSVEFERALQPDFFFGSRQANLAA